MPAVCIRLKPCQTDSARTSGRQPLLLACAAIALCAAPSSAQLSPSSSAPATSRPATRPATPADKGVVPPDITDAIRRAERGDNAGLPKARKDLLAFVARYPENLDGLQQLAKAYELSPAPADRQAGTSAQDFTALADGIWLKAVTIAVKNADTSDQFQEAMVICDQALRRGPMMWPVNLELARLLAKGRRGGQAVERYTAYLKSCREATPIRVDTQACLELARLYLTMNRWRQAVQTMLEARTDDPTNAEVCAVLAEAYRLGASPANKGPDQRLDESERKRLLNEAANAIDEALRKDPRNHDYLLAKVNIRGERNLNDDKNRDLDEAIDAACLAVRLTAEALQQKPGDDKLLAQLSRSYDAFGATLMERVRQNKGDTAALVQLLRMARRHTDVQREIALRQLLQRLDGLAGETSRNDPAVKAMIHEIGSQLDESRAGAADLPVATRPGS